VVQLGKQFLCNVIIPGLAVYNLGLNSIKQLRSLITIFFNVVPTVCDFFVFTALQCKQFETVNYISNLSLLRQVDLVPFNLGFRISRVTYVSCDFVSLVLVNSVSIAGDIVYKVVGDVDELSSNN
jgi:hypothetical protein